MSTGLPSNISFGIESCIKEQGAESSLKEIWNADTVEPDSERMSLSTEDRRFLQIMKDSIKLIDGRYEVPMPFREEHPSMPNNRSYAIKRAESVKRKLLSDDSHRKEYVQFMAKVIDSGYARIAQPLKPGESSWILPHFAVYHPTKGKIRVVLDCSAKYKGVSLNCKLLQGPDLTNHMAGVFIRFREDRVPIIGDLEAMYCQVLVPEHQRRYIRFLWWPDGNLESRLQEYEMCVHVFGAISSMGCVNYALRQAAADNVDKFGVKAAETLKKDFYVDDLTTSVSDDADAIELIPNIVGMCEAAGFNLTKMMSSSPAVVEVIPVEKRSEALKDYCLSKSSLVERPLGVLWTIENDSLGFNVTFKTGALTRCGILSTINGIYDLLGIASPFLLKGRKVLQEITAEKVGWDAEVSAKHVKAWCAWKDEIVLLRGLEFPRCYKPDDLGEVVDTSIHTYGDGCSIGYGAACYIRQVNKNGDIAVSLAMGKSRVSPLKMITIPRLELTASTTAIKIGAMVRDQLRTEVKRMFYYTDNKVTLGYICNDVKRFRVFVANRQQLIRSYSSKEDWSYVDTKQNPADDASRGLCMKQEEKVNRWIHGPERLYQNEESWPNLPVCTDVADGDPEVAKKVHVATMEPDNLLDTLERRLSGWIRMKRALAVVRLYMRKLKAKAISRKQHSKEMNPKKDEENKTDIRNKKDEESKKDGKEENGKDDGKIEGEESKKDQGKTNDEGGKSDEGKKKDQKRNKNQGKKIEEERKKELREAEVNICNQLTVKDQEDAESMMIRNVQNKYFKREIAELKQSSERKRRKKVLRKLRKLDPFIDDQGVLRAGGRLRNSGVQDAVKFPVILPRKASLSQKIVDHFHRLIHHRGRSSTVNEIRENGYWIIGISGIVRSLIFHCVGCRIQRGSLGSQKMADLPSERVSFDEAQFTYCGVDMFGPFKIKEGRKELKRYCALFTCFSSRAVHIEVTKTMDTDSFIQALRRFVARRGPVRTVRSDNGGNFVGAENELNEAWKEMDHAKIADFLKSENCDWERIKWEKNVPTASHMGGAWERQIRTVRSVLNAITMSHKKLLDDESFVTWMTEVEAIVNSRPLTLQDVNDPDSRPLSPANLLTLKSKVVMPPPGTFQEADLYCRKRWRAVQFLANEFWQRWRKEYLLVMQTRSKWTEKRRNLQIGDVLLLKDEDVGRNKWPMGIVVGTHPGDDGLVRSVEVRISSGSIVKRPVNKLVVLVESSGVSEPESRTIDDDSSSKGEC